MKEDSRKKKSRKTESRKTESRQARSSHLDEHRKSGPYHHGDLRNTLIREAVSIIETEGIEGLTLRKAARGAGVSHNAPSHHFGDLKGLLAAVAEEGFRLMVEEMERAAGEPSGDPLERMAAVGLAYVEFSHRHASFFKIMFHPMLADKNAYPGLKQASSQALDLLTGLIGQCQERGSIIPGDPREFALFAWSVVHGLASLHADRQIEGKGLNAGISEYAGRILPLVYLGLRAG